MEIMNKLRNILKPEVGMGATQIKNRNKTAATVVEIVAPDEVILQQDSLEVNVLKRNPRGIRVVAKLRGDGRWTTEEQHPSEVVLGVREAHLGF